MKIRGKIKNWYNNRKNRNYTTISKKATEKIIASKKFKDYKKMYGEDSALKMILLENEVEQVRKKTEDEIQKKKKKKN